MSVSFSQIGPSGRIVSVTKADSDLVGGVTRGLWVGTAGTANLVDESGVTLSNFPLVVGLNPVRVAQVKTGGTADDIWALY
jgi:hypothetical protein